MRAKVEHPFRQIKRQFGYTKARYRGLAKNTAQIGHCLRCPICGWCAGSCCRHRDQSVRRCLPAPPIRRKPHIWRACRSLVGPNLEIQDSVLIVQTILRAAIRFRHSLVI